MRNEELDEAADLLSRGMGANPNHIAVFDIDEGRRRRIVAAFFRPVLHGLAGRGMILAAFDEGVMVGVCGMAPPGCCAPGSGEKVRILARLLRRGSPGVPLRVLRWARVWSSREPRVPHWHLGPVAVDVGVQGRGIGGAMMDAFCRIVDEAEGYAYLETDKRENLPFYERHGFTVIGQNDVLGVPNWYMARDARRSERREES